MGGRCVRDRLYSGKDGFLIRVMIVLKKLRMINWLPKSMLLIQRYQALLEQSRG